MLPSFRSEEQSDLERAGDRHRRVWLGRLLVLQGQQLKARNIKNCRKPCGALPLTIPVILLLELWIGGSMAMLRDEADLYMLDPVYTSKKTSADNEKSACTRQFRCR